MNKQYIYLILVTLVMMLAFIAFVWFITPYMIAYFSQHVLLAQCLSAANITIVWGKHMIKSYKYFN